MPTPARKAASWVEIVVAAKGQRFAIQPGRKRSERAQRALVAVVADKVMRREVLQRYGRPHALKIVRVGVEPDARDADQPRHQRPLGRPHHAHRDVGVAAQQVLVAVGDRELQRDARMHLPKAR